MKDYGKQPNKSKYWSKGFEIKKGHRVYHPYTAYDIVNPLDEDKELKK